MPDEPWAWVAVVAIIALWIVGVVLAGIGAVATFQWLL